VLLVLGGAGRGVYLARASRRVPTAALHQRTSSTLASPPAVFDVIASSPASGQKAVVYSPLVRVQFSQPLARQWPHPILIPTIPGSWVRIGRSMLEFRPTANFVPYSKVTLLIPGGADGIRDYADVALAAPYRTSFTIAGASMLRLQQLLAELGYLPIDFVGGTTKPPPSPGETVAQTKPVSLRIASANSVGAAVRGAISMSSSNAAGAASGSRSPLAPRASQAPAAETLDGQATQPDAVGLTPEQGSFSWRYANIPSSLAAIWQPGVNTVVVRGAVMAFESAHGLPPDGDAGPQVWRALLEAVAHRQLSNSRYDYVEVTTSSPETLHVWQDGKIIYQTLANTGIAEAPTAPGTFPVYVRYASTTMNGYDPNGSYYDDSGVPYVAYFNGGDAVHGFLRAQYGSPQSLGCVELPYANAAVVFNYDPIGTLVNVA
jgi:peptidoglycan hydrolase-like protein with peptidoglycan-binding domain